MSNSNPIFIFLGKIPVLIDYNTTFEFNLLQNAGESAVANIDKLLTSEGDAPTAELRLKMQKVCCIMHQFLMVKFASR